MWTEQTAFIESGKKNISAVKVMEAMNLRALWGGVGCGVVCVHGKGRREKKEGLK